MTSEAFAPFQMLAAELLKCLPASQQDGSHDQSHIHRVWVNVQRIQRVEGGDLQVLLAATVLHDCVAVEKNSPLRGQASTLSADKAASILAGLGWPFTAHRAGGTCRQDPQLLGRFRTAHA
jgi:Predicted HD superfamily hydrolase